MESVTYTLRNVALRAKVAGKLKLLGSYSYTALARSIAPSRWRVPSPLLGPNKLREARHCPTHRPLAGHSFVNTISTVHYLVCLEGRIPNEYSTENIPCPYPMIINVSAFFRKRIYCAELHVGPSGTYAAFAGGGSTSTLSPEASIRREPSRERPLAYTRRSYHLSSSLRVYTGCEHIAAAISGDDLPSYPLRRTERRMVRHSAPCYEPLQNDVFFTPSHSLELYTSPAKESLECIPRVAFPHVMHIHLGGIKPMGM